MMTVTDICSSYTISIPKLADCENVTHISCCNSIDMEIRRLTGHRVRSLNAETYIIHLPLPTRRNLSIKSTCGKT